MGGLSVRGLRVVLPDGRALIEDLSLEVAPGQVAVLLGGSGTGKSTFARVLFEREELERAGFEVVQAELRYQRGDLGLVPQRGALFDHLDVRGNVDIALRYASAPRRASRGAGAREAGAIPGVAPAASPKTTDPSADDPRAWLERVGLEPALAEPGVPVAQLSGGQAQRVAVARALASKRRLLFLDEPSVGLDPHRVRMLARLLRRQVVELDVAAVVVTHDVALAAGAGDRLYAIDPATRKAIVLFEKEWPGPLEDLALPPAERGAWLVRLEGALVDLIAREAPPASGRRRPRFARALRERLDRVVAPFRTAAESLMSGAAQLARRPRDFAAIAGRVAAQTFLRPLPFYAIVSVLIGYTVLYVISKVGGAGVRPDALVRQIGGSYVVALAPPLSAMLFVAASGSATNAWLGSLELGKQGLALEALGVSRRSYLWGPAWWAVGTTYLAVAALFAAGMVVGGLLVCRQYGMQDSFALLTGDILDPRPERFRYAIRAGFLVWVYGWGLASDVVARGGSGKPDADAVTRAMTGSVVASTLWVVGWELVTVLVLFGT